MKTRPIRLGDHGPWFFRRPLLLLPAEIQTHMHVIGVSGSGKSRFLAALVLELLETRHPLTLIDPHGDLARLVLGHLIHRGFYKHPNAYERLIYLDIPAAQRAGRYLPFNVLQQNASPYTIAANIMESFHRAFPSLNQGAPMFDTLVQNGVKALISAGLPLPSLKRFLTDKAYRDAILTKESDPDVVSVFHDWFDKLAPRDQMDQSGSTIRRVDLLTFDPVLKHSVGAPENLLDFRTILDEGRSLIVNLSLANGDARRLYGCLLTVMAEQGALARAELPPEARQTSHHLILDEFSQFTAQSGEALTTMLSETRKFRFFAILSHQNWSQTDAHLRGGLGNVGAHVVFQLERDDAQYTAPILGRVEPKSTSHREEQDTEGVGMREQWEEWVQALQDLPQRRAYIRFKRRRKKLHHKLLRTKPTMLYEMHAPKVSDNPASPEAQELVEREYLHRYFREPRPLPTIETAPLERRQRVQNGQERPSNDKDVF